MGTTCPWLAETSITRLIAPDREADQHSQQLVSNASKHADQIVARAKAQADRLLTDTANQISRLQAAAQDELGELTRQKENISSYLAPIRELLST